MTSKIKVDNINKVSDDSNIINKCGTTITLGASGDTVNLASGASQSGFGRTGTVDWQTGSIKTGTFTAANGEGYFINTSAGVVTCNLPAGTTGAIFAVADYTRTFANNNLTITPNGSEKMGGVTGSVTMSTNGQAGTFIYVDANEGWINVEETDNSQTAPVFICASVSGACNTLTTAPCCANVKVAKFVSPGTFTVTQISNIAIQNDVGYQIVGGGGGGGFDVGGGGGAGGYREVKSPTVGCYTASPLEGYAISGNRVTVTASPGSYPIVVGGGGAGSTSIPVQNDGNDSSFSTITAAGGGFGGAYQTAQTNGNPGGSGGGGGGWTLAPHTGGSGNTPPTSPPQGQDGGANANPPGGNYTGGGGGGAGGAGSNSPASTSPSAQQSPGGPGVASCITGSPVTLAAGGFGSNDGTPFPSYAQPDNSGNGGGGGGAGMPCSPANCGQTGGSGIVIIRYKFQ